MFSSQIFLRNGSSGEITWGNQLVTTFGNTFLHYINHHLPFQREHDNFMLFIFQMFQDDQNYGVEPSQIDNAAAGILLVFKLSINLLG